MQTSPPLSIRGREVLAAAIRLRKVARVAEGGWPTKKNGAFHGLGIEFIGCGRLNKE